MKGSPVYTSYMTSDYGGYEFDPQVDFTQFLEEAKQHARDMKCKSLSPPSTEAGKGRTGEEKKSKKSWKNSLLNWWKPERKSKSSREPACCSNVSNRKKGGHVSGPIYGTERGVNARHHRPISGPITNLFIPKKRGQEMETPYVCLDQLNNHHGMDAYGPVYLVT